MLSFKCRDVGFDCDYTVKGDNDNEMIKKVMEHGRKDHNMNMEDFTPSLVERIRGKMQAVE